MFIATLLLAACVAASTSIPPSTVTNIASATPSTTLSITSTSPLTSAKAARTLPSINLSSNAAPSPAPPTAPPTSTSTQRPSTGTTNVQKTTAKASPTTVLSTTKAASSPSTATTGSTQAATEATSTTAFEQFTASLGSLPPPAHLPTLLEERLDTLACDISLPPNAKIWRANQTEELLLPIQGEPVNEDNAWSGTSVVQTGDVLLVKIDDAPLEAAARNRTRKPPMDVDTDGQHRRRQPDFSVYQVTRLGYEHCDATEGVLLDITPLQVDGRQVVTLYDKDLTEGINLLIVVSTKWLDERCVRLRVVVKSDNCGDAQDCSAKGVCFTNGSMEGYECQCCAGFVGAHCEEQDACYPSPCQNHGICVDISQGHEGTTFQCLCPYGFTGKTCEQQADPCDSSPCLNGGTCAGNATHFECACAAGFVGQLCQHNRDECASAPCVHGICVDQEDGYRCFCQPGFAGEHCEYEYNECESSPCINGGTCTDHIGGYSCDCGRGYSGKRCHVKVDLCDPNPCAEHRYCLDRGNNYSCECPKGFTGPDCMQPSKSACSGKPCRNGGTCWSSANTFYCACRPGFTGKTCQDRFLLEAIPTPQHPSDPYEPAAPADAALDIPISIHLDHLHSVYIAVGTLASALLIVTITVTVCHCRLHKTYRNCTILPFRSRRLMEEHCPSSPCAPLNKLSVPDKGRPLASSRSFPPLGDSDMYYTLDFSDSQSSPLIQ
ncbi:delta and Notch-like epidermal growth factor-related receptor isoform X2 [Neocloeon triangulifer]|nr:delta and Notch-like epidermal growth factor-related receptor isoform X2 [Neocloeon triangulifer]XP_059481608.1 delta and Notch-like epidermal growth factor-related receptor isoform X2 [Neocloeon triangulifer]